MIDKKLLKTGDIILTSSNTFLAKAIKWFTKSKYNHIGTILIVEDIIYIVESNSYDGGAGVINTPIDSYLNSDKKLLFRRPYFNINEEAFTSFCLENVGKFKYDFKTLLFIQPWHTLTGGWLGTKKVENDSRLICSQFIAYLFHTLHKNLFRNYHSMTPADFVNSHLFFDLFKKE